MNEPMPYSTKTCPNRARHHDVKRRCPMCGMSGAAYRTGERLGMGMIVLGVLVLVVVLGMSLVGCSPTTPESEFRADVRAAATESGYVWTEDLERDVFVLADAVCDDLDGGRPLDSIRDEVIAEAVTPQSGRVILAAVDAAAAHLCEATR